MLRTLFLALAAASVAGVATADDIAPLAGKAISLKAAAGVVYYTKEAAGFRVVATLNGSEGAAPLRFVATLADGQSLTVSVPVGAGEPPQDLEISRSGETLSLTAAEPPMIRASLD